MVMMLQDSKAILGLCTAIGSNPGVRVDSHVT